MGNKLCNECFGKTLQSSQKILKVATINYGGVLKNPFEFYSEDQQDEIKLSKTFCQILKSYLNIQTLKANDWDVGKIDLKMQQNRYSPLYNPNVGIDHNKFITVKNFNQLWQKYYSEANKKIDWGENQPTKNQIQTIKLFDLICFHAILVHTNNISSTKKLEKIDLSKQNVQKYQKFMQNKFCKSFLDEQKKIDKFIHMLQKIDVAFVQQSTDLLIKKIKSDQRFQVRQNGSGNSMIILRKENFIFKQKSYEIEKLQKLERKGYLKFKENEDIVYLCINKTILISAHLSSKKEKNKPEVQAMKTFLNNLRKDYPGYNIILGADANSFVKNEFLDRVYSIFPTNENTITTRKKRTFLQPQFKKGDIVVEACKDHIITSLQIVKQSIRTIKLEIPKERLLLPTNEHPFDHFMAVCCVRMNQQNKRSIKDPFKNSSKQDN